LSVRTPRRNQSPPNQSSLETTPEISNGDDVLGRSDVVARYEWEARRTKFFQFDSVACVKCVPAAHVVTILQQERFVQKCSMRIDRRFTWHASGTADTCSRVR